MNLNYESHIVADIVGCMCIDSWSDELNICHINCLTKVFQDHNNLNGGSDDDDDDDG